MDCVLFKQLLFRVFLTHAADLGILPYQLLGKSPLSIVRRYQGIRMLITKAAARWANPTSCVAMQIRLVVPRAEE